MIFRNTQKLSRRLWLSTFAPGEVRYCELSEAADGPHEQKMMQMTACRLKVKFATKTLTVVGCEFGDVAFLLRVECLKGEL